MTTATVSHPRRAIPSRRNLPMGTAEFLDYLVNHPATRSLGRRFADLVADTET